MKPFDGVRAAFWLVAFVIGMQCLVVLIGVVFCAWHGEEIASGKFQCDKNNRLSELLSAALAAALAFMSRFANPPPPDKPP